jgi:hypothetical protein
MAEHRTLEQLEASWAGFNRPKDGDQYRHYKGGLYEIVATGFLEATEQPCVIYRSLKNNSIWVRTVENFFELIDRDAQPVPRFKLI